MQRTIFHNGMRLDCAQAFHAPREKLTLAQRSEFFRSAKTPDKMNIYFISRLRARNSARLLSQNLRTKTTGFRQSSFYGAGDEARTRYLHLGKVALYRMSYTRIRQMQV